jgi:hypothetical protein
MLYSEICIEVTRSTVVIRYVYIHMYPRTNNLLVLVCILVHGVDMYVLVLGLSFLRSNLFFLKTRSGQADLS